MLYRLDAATGRYVAWAGTDTSDLMIKTLWGNDSKKPESANAMDVKDGRLYLAFTPADTILVLDSKSGKLIKQLHVAKPTDVKAAGGKLYVVSEGKSVLAVNPETGETAPFIGGLRNARAMALDARGPNLCGLARTGQPGPRFRPRRQAHRQADRPQGRAEAAGPLDARRHGVYRLPDGGRGGQAVGRRGRHDAQTLQLLGHQERQAGQGVLRPDDLRRAGRRDQPARPVPDGRTRLRMAHRSRRRAEPIVWA